MSTTAQALQVERPNPLVVKYEDAVQALRACCTLEETTRWDQKADALAAWAKIYRSNEASITARRLKLHAYRRMGELARALRPGKQRGLSEFRGPSSLLREQGLTAGQVTAIRQVCQIPQPRFDQLVTQPCPPPITKVAMEGRTRHFAMSLIHCQLMGRGHPNVNLASFASFTRRVPASSARDFKLDEAVFVRATIREIQDWLDELEQNLPSAKSKV